MVCASNRALKNLEKGDPKRSSSFKSVLLIKVIRELIRNYLDITASKNVHLGPPKIGFGDTSTFTKKCKSSETYSRDLLIFNTYYGYINDSKVSTIFQIFEAKIFFLHLYKFTNPPLLLDTFPTIKQRKVASNE